MARGDGGAGAPLPIEVDSGEGLLDARALWACIVGPHRLAMAKRSSVRLSNNAPTEIARNMGAAKAYMFVGVALPGANPAPAALPVIFSKQEALGTNASAPFLLTTQMGGGPFAPSGFMQLLLPGEQLFAQVVTGGPAVQPVVVAQVQF